MLKNLYFSQNALTTFQVCPLKFRYRYIDGLYWPKLWDGRDSLRVAMELGHKFHLLAQRYCEGLDPEVPAQDPYAETLKSWLEELKNFLPLNPGHTYLPEHELRIINDDLKIMAKYDLVEITPGGKVIIYDWKTYRGPKKKSFLESHLQTRVYTYTFVEGGHKYVPGISPEDIVMIYWHPVHMKNGIHINYSAKKHRLNSEFITGMVKDILSRSYENFPGTPEERVCASCEYRPVCQGLKAEFIEDDDLMDDYIEMEEIPEISF